MGVWLGQIIFSDVERKAVLNLEFPNAAGVFDGAEFSTVKTLVDNLRIDIQAMSRAAVGSRVIFEQEPATVPDTLDKTISVYDKMTVVAYTDEVDEKGNWKTFKLDISAPDAALFEGTANGDLNGPLFTALSAELELARIFGWRVSDGENFDISRGVAGFKSALWTTRKGRRSG